MASLSPLRHYLCPCARAPAGAACAGSALREWLLYKYVSILIWITGDHLLHRSLPEQPAQDCSSVFSRRPASLSSTSLSSACCSTVCDKFPEVHVRVDLRLSVECCKTERHFVAGLIERPASEKTNEGSTPEFVVVRVVQLVALSCRSRRRCSLIFRYEQ